MLFSKLKVLIYTILFSHTILCIEESKKVCKPIKNLKICERNNDVMIEVLTNTDINFGYMMRCAYATSPAQCNNMSNNTCVWADNQCHVQSQYLLYTISECIDIKQINTNISDKNYAQNCMQDMQKISKQNFWINETEICTTLKCKKYDQFFSSDTLSCKIIYNIMRCSENSNFDVFCQNQEQSITQQQLLSDILVLMSVEGTPNFLTWEYLEVILNLHNKQLQSYEQCNELQFSNICEYQNTQQQNNIVINSNDQIFSRKLLLQNSSVNQSQDNDTDKQKDDEKFPLTDVIVIGSLGTVFIIFFFGMILWCCGCFKCNRQQQQQQPPVLNQQQQQQQYQQLYVQYQHVMEVNRQLEQRVAELNRQLQRVQQQLQERQRGRQRADQEVAANRQSWQLNVRYSQHDINQVIELNRQHAQRMQLQSIQRQRQQESTITNVQDIISRLEALSYQERSESDQSEQCIICLDEFHTNNRVVYLPCCHKFHFECVKEWIETSGVDVACPVCNLKISTNLQL